LKSCLNKTNDKNEDRKMNAQGYTCVRINKTTIAMLRLYKEKTRLSLMVILERAASSYLRRKIIDNSLTSVNIANERLKK